MHKLTWVQAAGMESRAFRCGWCGNDVASQQGWSAQFAAGPSGRPSAGIWLCHLCTRPTFFDVGNGQTPGFPFGSPVADVPDKAVMAIYEEARKAHGVDSFTAAVLCCRKLLMHIAVSKGADPGLPFAQYVQYLADNHFIPPDAHEWVDHIREKGNEATHEITIMAAQDSQDLLTFSAQLMKVIFEFPAAVKRRRPGAAT